MLLNKYKDKINKPYGENERKAEDALPIQLISLDELNILITEIANGYEDELFYLSLENIDKQKWEVYCQRKWENSFSIEKVKLNILNVQKFIKSSSKDILIEERVFIRSGWRNILLNKYVYTK